MVGTITTRQARVRNIFAAVAALAIAIAVACGSDDPAPAAAPTVPPTAVPAPTSTRVPTATPEPVLEPVEVPVVPAAEPEAGSNEAMILAAFERQVTAVNNEDWEAILEVCNPTIDLPTVEQVRFMYETYGVRYDPLPKVVENSGLNWRNATVKIYSEDTASTGGDIFNYDEFVVSGATDLWTKVDGQWYWDGIVCRFKS